MNRRSFKGAFLLLGITKSRRAKYQSVSFCVAIERNRKNKEFEEVGQGWNASVTPTRSFATYYSFLFGHGSLQQLAIDPAIGRFKSTFATKGRHSSVGIDRILQIDSIWYLGQHLGACKSHWMSLPAFQSQHRKYDMHGHAQCKFRPCSSIVFHESCE
ncbi:hypothetical protein BJ138DRAFT_1150303 [Hygrophoropsis aurantiaca]|uniref:Uncharacterized protein n=1 Tax=Hygrophoropsis aurantiaca TaxID=72124 RepID=A0ACB8AE00_9AGAM|nr:hypothetical protein BJ138DRAFT_1150303 [Hygrophoropsis aurantiaca]